MKRSQRMLHALLIGTTVVGFLSLTSLAEPPRTLEKRTAKKTTGSKTADSGQSAKTPSAAKASNRNSNSVTKRDAPISQERAESAVRFAQKHHPELAVLLDGLRESDSRNFQAGLRVLTRDAERLGKMVERQDERYPVSLDLWKLDSRIRLEIARLSMSPHVDFEPRLRPLMEKRQATRLKLVQMERQRTAERLAKYDEELKPLQSRSDGLVGSEIDRLKKMMTARARAKGTRPSTSKDTASATPKRKTSKLKTSRPANSPTTSAD
jgi:hypothetical protein